MIRRILPAMTLGILLLNGCAYSPPAASTDEPPPPSPQLTQAEQEDQFWTAFQTRMGLLGTDYADPVKAKAGSVHYGRWLCGQLSSGIDPGVLVAQNVAVGRYTREEVVTEVNTSVEFLCPDQRKVS